MPTTDKGIPLMEQSQSGKETTFNEAMEKIDELLDDTGGGGGSPTPNPLGTRVKTVGVMLGSILFPPKVEGVSAGRLDDLKVSGSAYGTTIPQVYGRIRLAGNMIWATDLVESQQSSGGGKGSRPRVRTYTYFANFAMMLCRGPAKVKKIWAEDLLIYDDDATPKTSYTIRVYDGSDTQLPDTLIEGFLSAGNVPAYRGRCYVVFDFMNVNTWGKRIPGITAEVETFDGNVTVADILADVAEQCGISSGNYDFSEADDPVTGFIIADVTEGMAAVDPLLRAYNTDLYEADGKLKAKKRGGSLAATFPQSDLATRFWDDSEEPGPNVETKRMPDLELPFRVNVNYLDPGNRYQQFSQSATRYTRLDLQQEVVLNMPLVLEKDSARQIAETFLYTEWIERDTFVFALPPKWNKLTPGDAVGLPVGDGTKILRTRIVGQDISPFGVLLCAAVMDDPTAVIQPAGGGGDDIPDDTLLDPRTTAFVWNGNAITDDETETEELGVYAAAVPTVPDNRQWLGCVLYASRDGGTTYEEFAELPYPAMAGVTLSALPGSNIEGEDPAEDTLGTAIWYDDQYVDVDMKYGTPETRSELEVLNGANAVLIGDEIIQFQQVDVIATTPTRKYRLSKLLRGRRGTDAFWNGHEIGERAVFLDRNTISRISPIPDELIGETVLIKAVGEGQNIGEVTAQEVTIYGREFFPYTVSQVKGYHEENDIVITWQRRTRRYGQWANFRDALLSEEEEQYELEFMDPLDADTVLRTMTVELPYARYTEAQQYADLGEETLFDTGYVRIYQIGRLGRGYVKTVYLGDGTELPWLTGPAPVPEPAETIVPEHDITGGSHSLPADAEIGEVLTVTEEGVAEFEPPTNPSVLSAENVDTEGFSAGFAMALYSSGIGVVRASAEDATKPAIGVGIGGAAVGFAEQIATEGLVTLENWEAATGSVFLSPRATYFLSDSEPGKLVTSIPEGAGKLVQVIGVAMNPTTLDLRIDGGILRG